MNKNTTIYGKSAFDVQKEILDNKNNNEAIEFYCELTIDPDNNIVSHSCDSDLMSSGELDTIRKFIKNDLAFIAHKLLSSVGRTTVAPGYSYAYAYAVEGDRDHPNDDSKKIRYPQFRYTNTSNISDLVKVIICSTTRSCDIYCIDNTSNTVIKEITSTNNLTPIQLLIIALVDDITICDTIRNINSLKNMSRTFDVLMNTSSTFDIKNKDESELFDLFMETFEQTYVYNYLPRSKQNNNMSIVVENSFGIAGTEEVFSYMTDGSKKYCKFFCDGTIQVPSIVSAIVDVVDDTEHSLDDIIADTFKSVDEATERLRQESIEAVKKAEEERLEKASLENDNAPIPDPEDGNKNHCDGNCHNCHCNDNDCNVHEEADVKKSADDIISDVIDIIGKLASEVHKLGENNNKK